MRLAQLYPFPDFVKNASVDECRRNSIPGSIDYADPVHRDFPTHTPAATYVSAVYLLDKQASMPTARFHSVREALRKAASHHGIQVAIDRLEKAHEELKKEAQVELPDDCYAFVEKTASGVVRKMRLANTLDVKQAASWILKHRDQIPWRDRCKMASRVLDRGEILGVDFGDLEAPLERQAGFGGGDPKKIATMLRKRAAAAAPELKGVYQALSQHYAKAAAVPDAGELTKLAGLIYDADEACGIKEYSAAVERPEQVLFEITHKQAQTQASQEVQFPSGAVYKQADVGKVTKEDLRDFFGDAFLESCSNGPFLSQQKVASQAASMTSAQEAMMARLLGSRGVSPVRTGKPTGYSIL